MIGLVLVTHGRLAVEFVTAMEHVVGPQDAIAAVCIGPEDDMEGRRDEIAGAIASVEGGDGVILLTDLFGGTPSNLAISLMKADRVEVIAGVNLPMLIRLASARRQMKLKRAIAAARDAGRKYISVASDILGEAAAWTDPCQQTVRISNKRGLHARASAKFVTLASGQSCAVEVEKDGAKVAGTSIMGLMMLGAAMGDHVTISAAGEGAEQALTALVGLVESKFGED